MPDRNTRRIQVEYDEDFDYMKNIKMHDPSVLNGSRGNMGRMAGKPRNVSQSMQEQAEERACAIRSRCGREASEEHPERVVAWMFAGMAAAIGTLLLLVGLRRR